MTKKIIKNGQKVKVIGIDKSSDELGLLMDVKVGDVGIIEDFISNNENYPDGYYRVGFKRLGTYWFLVAEDLKLMRTVAK